MAFKQEYSPNLHLPDTVKYFKEEIVNEVLEIPPQKPDMERLLNTLVCVSVENLKLIRTEKGLSNEGQNLSGYKLLVTVRLREKVMYVADLCTQPVHASHYEDVRNFFVILPETIDDVPVCDLYKYKKLLVTPYVECVETRMLDKRHIHTCVMLLIDVKKGV